MQWSLLSFICFKEKNDCKIEKSSLRVEVFYTIYISKYFNPYILLKNNGDKKQDKKPCEQT